MNAIQGFAKKAAAFPIPAFLDQLTRTHTDTYGYLVEEPADYAGLLTFLNATREFQVDGRPLKVWLSLTPPAYTKSGQVLARCFAGQLPFCCRDLNSTQQCWNHTMRPPDDDPRTEFNETACFTSTGASLAAPSFGYYNYAGWGCIAGELAARWPHLVCHSRSVTSLHTYMYERRDSPTSTLSRQVPGADKTSVSFVN